MTHEIGEPPSHGYESDLQRAVFPEQETVCHTLCVCMRFRISARAEIFAMRAHNYLTFFIITTIGIAGVLFVIPRHDDAPPTTIPVATTTVSIATTTLPAPKAPMTPRSTATQEVPKEATSAPSAEVAAPIPTNSTTSTGSTPPTNSEQPSSPQTATFKIDGVSISVPVHGGEKVIDAMRTAASAGHLTFTTREYPGMGQFIDSINGKKNENGTYWILYINDTSSTLGASTASIGPGDTVEWRYKNSY